MAVEIRPTPARSLTAGFTELTITADKLSGPDGLPVFPMADVESVKLAFIDGTNAPVPVPASVVYTVESSIPRRPPLTFESVLLSVNDPAQLPLPTNLSSKPATVRLIPRPGADEATPPFVFPAPTGNTQTLAIPSERFAIRGSLRDAFGDMPGSFVARAFQNGALISNREQDEGGNFALIIPTTAAAADVNVELVPLSASQPWFKFEPFTPGRLTPTNTLDLGTVNLAAYVKPDQQSEGVQLTAVGAEPGRPPVPRALVRASVLMETTTTTPRGSTRFQLDSVTNEAGDATLHLLAGTAQNYEIRIFPEAGDVYASHCQTTPVVGPGWLGEFPLRRRPVRKGRLLSADNTPVANATVVATRSPPGPTECASPVQLSTTTTTRAHRLLFPQPRSRHVPDRLHPAVGVGVAAQDAGGNPGARGHHHRNGCAPCPGALVQGVVVDSFGDAVANARVSIFDPRCPSAEPCTLPPTLLAETLTGADGVFRVVAAVP